MRTGRDVGAAHGVVGNEAMVAQMRKGALEYCVMALIGDDERYGFELVQRLRDFDGVVTTEGTIYPLLSRLRKDGRVETSWRESDSGPPRRYYRLTESGRESLERFAREWERFRDSVNAILKERTTRSSRQSEFPSLLPAGTGTTPSAAPPGR
ncbi:MAG: PadR family transcriptional regulator [Candidatus Dormibacteria bacterium]